MPSTLGSQSNPNSFSKYDNVIAAVTASVSWVTMAVSELITKQREMVVRKPQKYLKGVLKNWLKDGVPYVEKSESAALEDFYQQEGVK